jgi:hypothetical protein
MKDTCRKNSRIFLAKFLPASFLGVSAGLLPESSLVVPMKGPIQSGDGFIYSLYFVVIVIRLIRAG